MARKRAPGGGRKSKGEFRGKTKTLSIRITPELRKRLEQEVRRTGRSLSSEAERQLRDSLNKRDRQPWEKPHQRATGQLVSHILERLERMTGEKWFESAFTLSALKTALELSLERAARVSPDAVEVPPTLAASAARWAAIDDHGADLARDWQDPARLGASVALGLMIEIENAEFPPFKAFKGRKPWFYGNEGYWLLADIRDRLGIKPVDWRPTQPGTHGSGFTWRADHDG